MFQPAAQNPIDPVSDHLPDRSTSISSTSNTTGSQHQKSEVEHALRQFLEHHGQDFIESVWLQTLGNEHDPFLQVVYYLERIRFPFEITENIKITEASGVDRRALMFDSNGQVKIGLTLNDFDALSAPVKSISYTGMIEVEDGEQKPEMSNFWRTLGKAKWFNESLQLAKPTFLPLVITSILINLLGLAPAIFSIQIYDRIIPNQAFESLAALTVGVLICLLFEHSLKRARHGLMEHVATLLDVSCTRLLSKRLLNTKTYNTSASRLLQHLRSFEHLRELITGFSLISLVDLPFVLLFLSVIALIHPYFLLISLVTIFLTFINLKVVHSRLQNAGQKEISATRIGQTEWIAAVTNLPTIQKLGINELKSDILTQKQLSQRLNGNRVRTLAFASGQRQHLIQQMGWISILIAGAYLTSGNQVSIGGMIAASMLSMRSFTPLAKLQGYLAQAHIARSGFSELHKFLIEPERQHENKAALVRIERLQLSQATLSIDGKKKQLSGINLKLIAGDRLAVIGPNSSGKTTLLNLLAGSFELHLGDYLINGQPLDRFHRSELAREIAIVEQPPVITEGTLLSNIQFDRPWVSGNDCVEALKTLGMLDWAESQSDGLHSPVSQNGSNLSSGKKQMLCIARAIAGSPSVLLLDEPSVCLDKAAESNLISFLGNLPDHMILVFTTHRKSLLDISNKLLVLQNGSAIKNG